MAIKVFCRVCETFIKEASEIEISKLTGKEICEDCGIKLKEANDFVDKKIGEYIKDLEIMLSDAKKKFGQLDTVHNKFFSEAKNLQTTVKAEINSMVGGNILK